MRTIVLYDSKTGAAKSYAEQIAQAIPGSDLMNINKGRPDLGSYDRIILGAGVRMSKAYGSFRRFLKKELPVLTEKQTALFLCNGAPETFDQTVEKSIPQELCTSVVTLSCLRGTEPFKKAEEVTGWQDEEALRTFIERVLD